MFKPVLNTTTRGLAIACMTTVAVPTAWSEDPSRASIQKWSRMLGYLVRPPFDQNASPVS